MSFLAGTNINTGRAFRSANGKMCAGCCGPHVEYGSVDCCAFYPPSPSAWSVNTNYSRGAFVSYEGYGYVSLINDNLGNVPAFGSQVWSNFTLCANDTWDDFSPIFGGFGKTPKYYRVDIEMQGSFSSPPRFFGDYQVNISARLIQYVGCQWVKFAGNIISGYVRCRTQAIQTGGIPDVLVWDCTVEQTDQETSFVGGISLGLNGQVNIDLQVPAHIQKVGVPNCGSNTTYYSWMQSLISPVCGPNYISKPHIIVDIGADTHGERSLTDSCSGENGRTESVDWGVAWTPIEG
jgi:hypothetical protein